MHRPDKVTWTWIGQAHVLFLWRSKNRAHRNTLKHSRPHQPLTVMAVDHGKHEHLPASGSLGATCHPSSSQPKHIFFFRACEFRYNTTDSASHLPVNLSIRRQNWILPVLIPNVHTAPLPPLRTPPAFLSQTPLLKGSDIFISAHYLQARYIHPSTRRAEVNTAENAPAHPTLAPEAKFCVTSREDNNCDDWRSSHDPLTLSQSDGEEPLPSDLSLSLSHSLFKLCCVRWQISSRPVSLNKDIVTHLSHF